ncbi:hypothetical protein D3C81_1823250 [compost metagenome]
MRREKRPSVEWQRYNYADFHEKESARAGAMGYLVGQVLPDVIQWSRKLDRDDLASRFPDVFKISEGELYLMNTDDASSFLFGVVGEAVSRAQAIWFAVVVVSARCGWVLTTESTPEGERLGFHRYQ